MEKTRKRRSLEELNVMDNFLMNAVAADSLVGKSFCQVLLSTLLQRKIGEVTVQVQSFIQGDTPDLRGIRMDVEVKESISEETCAAECKIYDIEPQIRIVEHLPKRSRFYQAKLDGKYLNVGEKEWNQLPDLYVMMITDYDPFGEKRMIYTFRNICQEMPEVEYNDGLTFVYFNVNGTIGGNEEIKSLLTYLKCSKIENVVDDTTRTIHHYVEHTKQSSLWRGKYMTIGEMLDEERDNGFQDGYKSGHDAGFQSGHDAGHSQGLEEGALQMCISLVKEGLLSIEKAAEKAGVSQAEFHIYL